MAGPEKCSNGYCEIPAGSFQMGSMNGDSDEQPVKTVGMTGFQLGQTEVSVADYQASLAKTASTQLQAVVSGCSSGNASQSVLAKAGETVTALFNRALQIFSSNSCTEIKITKSTPALPNFSDNKKGGNYPVVGLTMDEKRAYCQAQGGDLPTAAQLHYASRFDDQDSVTGGKDQRVIWDNGFRSTESVNGSYKNRFGVYNLSGNVWESALDAYDKDFYARMASTDPYNPMTNPYNYQTNPNGQLEEFSGGSFSSHARYARPANRYYDAPDNRNDVVGFRCARPLPQDSKK